MKLNLKVRLRNKAFWALFLPAVISFVYNVLNCFDIVPTIGYDWVMEVVNTILVALAAIGVLMDPTTAGLGDSAQAMTYERPKVDKN